jgi:hypothetical protein
VNLKNLNILIFYFIFVELRLSDHLDVIPLKILCIFVTIRRKKYSLALAFIPHNILQVLDMANLTNFILFLTSNSTEVPDALFSLNGFYNTAFHLCFVRNS